MRAVAWVLAAGLLSASVSLRAEMDVDAAEEEAGEIRRVVLFIAGLG